MKERLKSVVNYLSYPQINLRIRLFWTTRDLICDVISTAREAVRIPVK